MESSVTFTPKRAAGLFGAAFAFVFLMMHAPDAMPPGMLSASKWLVLLPAAFLLALRPSVKPWSSGLVLAGGVFVGVCIAAILRASNIWPIAGVYWTAIWLPPIVVGSAAGVFVARAAGGTRR
ncbi:MAG TPA: hypothetical protein VF329_10700 [Gammaproteobacteria bacterium]